MPELQLEFVDLSQNPLEIICFKPNVSFKSFLLIDCKIKVENLLSFGKVKFERLYLLEDKYLTQKHIKTLWEKSDSFQLISILEQKYLEINEAEREKSVLVEENLEIKRRI